MLTNHLKKMREREDGFTLIELLIVVLIIGILAAIAIPVYLGIQNQGYKSAVRADVNISVKRVQVGITEGRSIAEIKTNQVSYTQRSVKGEVVQILDSTASGASASDYQVKGVSSTSSTPAGPINYSYIYDSVTGKFTESDAVVLGSSIPSTTITTSSLPDATKDAAYSATVSVITTNPGGSTVYNATGLPTSLNMDSATGKISGIPANTGTYSVTVTASNAGVSDSRNYTLNVYSLPAITTTTLPAGDTSTAYTQIITASGTPTPTFAVTSGNLPSGVTLSSAGSFAGTPSATGTYNFSVTATNSAGSSTPPTAYTLVINAKPTITTTSLASGAGNVAYSQTVTATGTPAPTFAATGLPSTLSIDSSTGKIAGTPTAGGTYNVVVTATNTAGTATSPAYTLTIAAPPAAPTATPAISRFTDEGGSRVSFHNYMWAGNAGSCSTGQLEYYFVDSTGSSKGSTFWQTWSNFEIGSPYAVGTVNTWQVKTHCLNTSTGAVSSENISDVRSFTSLPTTGNLLNNASFENNNMNSWGTGAGSFTSLATATGAADTGTGSYMAVGTTSSGGASLEQDYGTSQAAGKVYYGSIWIRSTAGTGGANICIWNITTSQNNCKSYTVTNTWQQITTSYTLTSNTSQLRLEIYLGGSTTYQFDDAYLRPTS